MPLTEKAFTLVELMLVLVVMGVIAGLALPEYNRSVERTQRKDAENQLMFIYSAQKMYAARNNDLYWGPAVGATSELKLANINQNLGLNILANGKIFDCTVVNLGETYTCTATRVGGTGFTISITQDAINPGVNPSCSPVASCP
jgi:prepilin-type N-terminal cleavage/methylation domain-containing protein